MNAPPFYLRAREIAAKVRAPHGPIFAKKEERRGSLYIYDDIGASWFSDGVTAKDVAAKLDEMKGVSDLDVYINSPGGSVFEGVAILALLERFEAKKTVHVDGIAASIASVIAMAGDRIVMHRSGTMMIHDPWTAVMGVGNAEDLRGFSAEVLKTADVLDGLAGSIVAAYAKRTGSKTNEADLRSLMRAETWFSAEEAVEHGLAHAIEGEDATTEEVAKVRAPTAQDARVAHALAASSRALAKTLERFSGASPGQHPGQPGAAQPTTPARRQESKQ